MVTKTEATDRINGAGEGISNEKYIPLDRMPAGDSSFWKDKMIYHTESFYENGRYMGYQIYSDQNASESPRYTRTDRFYDSEGTVTKTEDIDRRTQRVLHGGPGKS